MPYSQIWTDSQKPPDMEENPLKKAEIGDKAESRENLNQLYWISSEMEETIPKEKKN